MGSHSPLLIALVVTALAALPARAGNPVQQENRRPGNPEWVLSSEANGQIQGYVSPASVNRGESVRIYVDTTDSTYTINIYRMGWYGGAGARLVAGPIVRSGTRQVIPTPDPATGMVECNWVDPYTLTVPTTVGEWPSGVYVVRLKANQSNKTKYTIFHVRDDARTANHLFISSINTSQAYNVWGGKSLYPDAATNRTAARMVSFNRPYAEGAGTGQFLFRWEYQMVRFLEREGYDVTYATDLDLHRRGNLLGSYQSILLAGHPEYWTWEMRAAVEAARDRGTSLGVFAGNGIYWQVRYAPSPITGEADRTLIGYKEAALAEDPYATDGDSSNDHLVTTNWRSAPVNRPEAELMGVQYVYNTITNGDIVIDDVTSAPWVFAETSLTQGSILPKLLGYEVDAMAAQSPAGIVRLGNSPYLNTKTNQTGYSHMTVYTHPSGATVFATGSIQWSWGLDAWNEEMTGAAVVPAAQQMTRNVLRRFAGEQGWRDCQYVLEDEILEAGNESGNGSVTLTTTSPCNWSVSSDTPWITITSAQSGSGSTTVTFAYDANEGGARTGTIRVADKELTVSQSSGCHFTLSTTKATAAAAGGTATFGVSTTELCDWTAESEAWWITVTAGATGRGNGTVTYEVAPNDGPERTGTITAATHTFAVTQANGCSYALDSSSLNVPSSGGSGTVLVTAGESCYWSSSSNVSWITIVSSDNGPGDGSVTFRVAANSGGSSRVGSLAIAGKPFTVRQPAGGAPTNLVATATSATSVSLTWTGSAGAARYEVARSAHDDFFYVVASPSSASFTDSGLTANTSYLYEVRAVDAEGNRSPFSLIEVATTVVFADDPLLPGSTIVRVLHLTQLRTAANALREAAGLSPRSWPDPVLTGTAIRAAHVLELRSAIAEARTELSLPPLAVSNGALGAGARVRAADLQELRNGVK